MKLFSKNSNLCDHNPPTSQTDRRTDRQTDRQTDRRHAITLPRFALRCNLRSNVSDDQINRGVGHFGPKFRGVSLGADPSYWGCKERTSEVN